MELVKLDAAKFGLEESKAADIAAQFQPMLDKMVELEKEYNEVVTLPIEDPATAKKAKEVRLKYVKVRTGTAEIHKKQKEFYLAGGRFVDGWKNAQLFASQGIEEKLEEIEKYAERKEAERIAALQLDRAEQLQPFGIENISALNLGTMTDEVWSAFFTGAKTNYEAKVEAERKSEQERIEKEKAELEERERIRIENERLKKEAEEREEAIMAERAEADAKLEAERKAAAEEVARLKGIADAQRIEAEKKAALEKQAKEKVEAELRAKQEAEAKAEAEKQASIEAELSKGDKEKFQSLLTDLSSLKSKYKFKSKKHQSLQNQVNQLIDKITAFATPKL